MGGACALPPGKTESAGTVSPERCVMSGLESHLEGLEPLLQRYGYAALFVCVLVEGMGVPAPGQGLLMAAALMAGRGELSLAWVLATTAAAATLGNALGWWIGSRGGRPLLQRWANPARTARVEAAFRRSGPLLVTLGRFVDGARQLNGLAAGAFGMPAGRFLAFNLLGALLWTACWGLGAFWLGRDLHEVAGWLHANRRLLQVAFAVAAVALVLWLLGRRRRRTGDQSLPPRSSE